MELADGIKEGDGDRVIRCWKLLMIVFHNSNRKNYAKEAALLLDQYHYLLTSQQAEQVIYSRFVNTAGLPGRNISADLHMEHLNRTLKSGIGALGSNKTEGAIVRLSKAIGTISPVLENFDDNNGIHHHHTRHKQASMKKDIHKVVADINKAKIFSTITGRKYSTFPNPKSLIHKVPEKDLLSWIQIHLSK